MQRTRLFARAVGTGLLVAGMGALAAGHGALKPPSPRIAQRLAQPTAQIDCSQSPFGKSSRVVQDVEFLSLFRNSTSGFDEHRIPFQAEIDQGETQPLVQMYRSGLTQGELAGTTFLTAANVDLNGDGRDEVAAAYYVGGPDDSLKVAVFERQDGFTPAARLLGVWHYTLEGMHSYTVRLAAGDFAGTRTRTQQLAVVWRVNEAGANNDKLHAVVLKGDVNGDGHIVDADNTASGEWRSIGTAATTHVGLAHGDFLLDGRDQLVAAHEAGNVLYYHLLEFNPDSITTPINSALPIRAGDKAIGSKNFSDNVNSMTDDGYVPINSGFQMGDHVEMTVQSFSSLPDWDGQLIASGGDVTDSAAAELVLHFSFLGLAEIHDQNPNGQPLRTQSGTFLAQRLLHFEVTQASPGANISNVQIASRAAGQPYDFNQFLGPRATDNMPWSSGDRFDATIGDLDGRAPNEIVLAWIRNSQLVTEIYHASVRAHAGFQFTKHASTGPFPVDFSSTASGELVGYEWNFGDGAGSIAKHPSHTYNTIGTFPVTLKVTDAAGKTSTYSTDVSINGQSGTGGIAADYSYQVGITPTYTTSTANSTAGFHIVANNFPDDDMPHVAIGDMNRDGVPEVMTLAQSVVDEYDSNDFSSHRYTPILWRSLWQLDAQGNFSGKHAKEALAATSQFPVSLSPMTASLLAGDFDGDTVTAVLGSDCRSLIEPQLRNLVWHPPFFNAMQSGTRDSGYIQASFGQSTTIGTGTESRSGSTTGHSVSGYLGLSLGYEGNSLLPFDKAHIRGTITATAGHDWQSSHGAIHGEENSQTYSEGQSASVGEGLVIAEADDANCYSYDVLRSTGPVPNSALRMCEIVYQERGAQTAELWNAQVDYAQVTPNWVPVQRDWASLALFKPVTSPMAFMSGKEADKAVDGLFSTAATSVTTTQPYLDIDLGQVQAISSIRVFPAANVDGNNHVTKPLAFDRAAVDLTGFRVYVSQTPITGPGVPSGAAIRVFSPGTTGEAVYDRWSIMTLDANFTPLQGRYIRLQHPGSQRRINVSEIQVYGDTHSDPPAFPDAVCDQTLDDGYFLARVWNPATSSYQNIEARGDLQWSGTNDRQAPTGVKLGNGSDCRNHVDVRETSIWKNLRIGNTGITNSWDSTSDTTNTVGSYGSFESTTRVGAEFDFEFGNVYVYAVAGASYEYSFGVTSDQQSTSFWGNGLQIGGSVGGFDPAFQNLVLQCGYFPHPYAYRLTDRGNASYRHDVYVTDYTVHQPLSGAWQRGAVPHVCDGTDRIFADGFGN